jgi:hypothetical protein
MYNVDVVVESGNVTFITSYSCPDEMVQAFVNSKFGHYYPNTSAITGDGRQFTGTSEMGDRITITVGRLS